MDDLKKRKKQKIAFGTNAIILMAVVIVVAVLLNLIVEQIPLNLDLTEEKFFTLTDTTEEVLGGLEDDITVYALYDRVAGESDSMKSSIIKILDLYDRDDRVKVEYIDLDKKPTFLKDTVGESNASDYSSGDYIVKCGDSFHGIDSDDMYTVDNTTYSYFSSQTIVTGLQVETKVTGAIVRVTSDVPVIYWSTAYDEVSLDDVYYSSFVESIEDSNFDLKTIDLKAEEIPEDATAIIFMSPQKDLDSKAVDKLTNWFNHGGNGLFFMDAKDTDSSYIYETFDNFNLVLERFNLKINTDIVDEGDDYKYVDNDSTDMIFTTTSLQAGSLEKVNPMKVVVHNTRSVSILDTASDYLQTEAILETSEDAKATSLEEADKVIEGKQVVAASGKHTGGYDTSRVVLFGSSGNLQLASMSFFGTAGVEIVKDSLEWFDIETVENPADGIASKSYNKVTKTDVDVTVEIVNVLAIVVAIAYPVIILLIGLVVWLKRRHL